MSTEPVIQFDHVTKKFSLQSHKTFKEFLPALIKGEPTKNLFTALNDISFSINRGETIGIIGPNGSGKSTILKLIAGVMTPTSGQITVRGKVSPLIELGAGFHPELSGKENIYLNASILGLSKREIDQRYRQIVDFSELWEFIDQPIKHYSSGMYLRLGFSVAVHSNFEILLLDEIITVGDGQFQQKCFQKMASFKEDKNITIVYVSHLLDTVKNFCNQAFYLDHSHLISQGETSKACDLYLQAQNQ